jgi:hypothetical protein
MQLTEITLALFSLCNIIRCVSYLPQILVLVRDREGAKAISCATWSSWIAANGSTAAYALINVTDWALFTVSILNALACAVVVLITVWKRRQLSLTMASL